MTGSTEKGLVSVVIPCRNEARHIAACVESIFQSDYPNLECVVVDGMSEDGTREVLEGLKTRYPNLKVVDNPHKLTPFAFNLGIKSASGDYILISGSRNQLSRDYVRLLKSELERDELIACAGGDYQHIFDSDLGRYISLAMESKFGMGGSNYRTQSEDADVDTVGVPLFPRWVFEKIGYFDERLTRNQDDEFSFRLRKAGYRIRYVHAAKNSYLVRSSLKKGFWQFFQYGYFKVFVSKMHGELTTLRQIVPAAFVAGLLVGPIVSVFWLPLFAVYFGILGFYASVVLLAVGKGLGLLERLNVLRAIFVLHFGYGLGYLCGAWDFLILNRSPRATFQRQTA